MKASDKDLNRKAFPKFLLWVGRRRPGGLLRRPRQRCPAGTERRGVGLCPAPGPAGDDRALGIPVSSVILLGICLAQYRSAKAICDSWDGEDETAPEEADRRLNVVLLCSSLAMILDFLFLGMGVLYTDGAIVAIITVAGDAGLRGSGGPGSAEDRGPDPADEPGGSRSAPMTESSRRSGTSSATRRSGLRSARRPTGPSGRVNVFCPFCGWRCCC